MRYFFLFLVLFASLLPSGASAQQAQVLCERGLGTYQAAVPYSQLYITPQPTATAPDSLLLCVRQPPGATSYDPQTRTRLVWVSRTTCDTARFASLYTGQSFGPVSLIRRRRGDLLVAGTLPMATSADSEHVFLRSYSRRGTLRWARTYAPALRNEVLASVLESPDRGAYLTIKSARLRLSHVDSLGHLRWQRHYCPDSRQSFSYGRPVYTTRGNLLLVGNYDDDTRHGGGLLLEVNQHGDSLTSRFLPPPYPGRGFFDQLNVRALQDGGFLLTSSLDTVINSFHYYLPCVVRLNADLMPRWQYVHRLQLQRGIQDVSQGGYELADGSLLVALGIGYTNNNSGALRLLHLSAAGSLLTVYPYQSSHPALNSLGEWLTPLAADSSFVLVSGGTNPYGTYLDRFRLPGLRRVLPEPGIPPAQVLAARAPLAAFPTPAYPNPGHEAVTVPLPPGNGAGRLRLRDLTGRLVREQATAAGAAQVALPLGGVAQGVYLLQFERAGQPPATQRLAVGP